MNFKLHTWTNYSVPFNKKKVFQVRNLNVPHFSYSHWSLADARVKDGGHAKYQICTLVLTQVKCLIPLFTRFVNILNSSGPWCSGKHHRRRHGGIRTSKCNLKVWIWLITESIYLLWKPKTACVERRFSYYVSLNM